MHILITFASVTDMQAAQLPPRGSASAMQFTEHRSCGTTIQESCTVAKMTARCALHIDYSTLILFTPTSTTLSGFDSERI